jgi:hypothetical protein
MSTGLTKPKRPVGRPRKTPKADDTKLSDQAEAFLRADRIVAAINKELADEGYGGLPAIPEGYMFRKHDAETTKQMFFAVAEINGGVSPLLQLAQSRKCQFADGGSGRSSSLIKASEVPR